MALDRLARNVQFNHGNVDMERMKKFLPSFTLGETTKKQSKYVEFVEQCKEMVSEHAKAMYFS